MNRRILFLLLLIQSCIQSHSFFEDRELQLNVGPLFNFARYKLGTLPKIQGYLAGLYTDCQLRTCSGLFTSLDFFGRWNAGFVCGNQDTKSQIKDYRPEWLLGYSWYSMCNTFETTPFAGLGFYYLSNELKPDIMTQRYFSLFVPVGLFFRKEICPETFEIGFSVLYRAYVWTRLKLETPNITACNNEKIELKRSHGVHVKMPLTWLYPCYCRDLDFQVKVVPFFDWNRFGQADECSANGIPFAVPKLDRWYLGLHLDLGLRF